MSTLTLKKKDPRKCYESLAQPAIADVKSLAQKLIQEASQMASSGVICDEGEGESEVLLDLEIEGVRCLILRTTPKTTSATVTLSPREQEIARMIAKGYPNKTIAAVLDISAWTVCTHIRRVFAKLGVGSRAEMVAKLSENGMLAGTSAISPLHTIRHKE